jgi:hypothetical protein
LISASIFGTLQSLIRERIFEKDKKAVTEAVYRLLFQLSLSLQGRLLFNPTLMQHQIDTRDVIDKMSITKYGPDTSNHAFSICAALMQNKVYQDQFDKESDKIINNITDCIRE